MSAVKPLVCKLCAQIIVDNIKSNNQRMEIITENNLVDTIAKLFDLKLTCEHVLQFVCEQCLSTLSYIAVFMKRVFQAQAELVEQKKDPLIVADKQMQQKTIKPEPPDNVVESFDFLHVDFAMDGSQASNCMQMNNSLQNCSEESFADSSDSGSNSMLDNAQAFTKNFIAANLPAEQIVVAAKTKQKFEFNCDLCDIKFKQSRRYRLHMQQMHQTNVQFENKCSECNKSFSSPWNLDRHKQQVHCPKPAIWEGPLLPCPHCEKSFKSQSVLQRHIKCIHLDLRPILCDICGIAVRSNTNLKEHMLTHTDEAPFECEICKKAFKNQIRLKYHMSVHDNRKHICVECGLELNSRETLNRHSLVHSDKMQHKCDHCGKAFKRAKALKNHLILHTGLKPYTCDFCDRSFANGSNCRSHKKKAHAELLAAQEAAGICKTYTRNIPKLEALKAVTRNSVNLAPVACKQSGHFANGKKFKCLSADKTETSEFNAADSCLNNLLDNQKPLAESNSKLMPSINKFDTSPSHEKPAIYNTHSDIMQTSSI